MVTNFRLVFQNKMGTEKKKYIFVKTTVMNLLHYPEMKMDAVQLRRQESHLLIIDILWN
jgi:hypothetical protein